MVLPGAIGETADHRETAELGGVHRQAASGARAEDRRCEAAERGRRHARIVRGQFLHLRDDLIGRLPARELGDDVVELVGRAGALVDLAGRVPQAARGLPENIARDAANALVPHLIEDVAEARLLRLRLNLIEDVAEHGAQPAGLPGLSLAAEQPVKKRFRVEHECLPGAGVRRSHLKEQLWQDKYRRRLEGGGSSRNDPVEARAHDRLTLSPGFTSPPAMTSA